MKNKTKGILLDYGGTIDTNGIHWFEVFYKMYCLVGIGIDKEVLRKAYIFGEQQMELNSHLVKPYDTFKVNLQQKVGYQISYLIQHGNIEQINEIQQNSIVQHCDNFARQNTAEQSNTLNQLAQKYPLVLVSNFYGNLLSVLEEYRIGHYFKAIVESSKVGIRKPNPQLFKLGVEALKLNPQEVTVIGDSFKNDIAPAQEIGCTTIWLKGIGWDDEEIISTQQATYCINKLEETLLIL